MFWGVQYHPETALDEIAGALRRQAAGLIEADLARSRGGVEACADLVDTLHREPGRRDVTWRRGLDEQVSDAGMRLTELRDFIEALVEPHTPLRDWIGG